MLLKALSQGGDPNRQKAIDCMGTNLLRVRIDMPVGMALTKITERNPDAVIVLDMEKKFVGYLSAEDYRSIKNQFRVNTAEERIPTTIGEAVDLRDEFRNVSSKDRLRKKRLYSSEGQMFSLFSPKIRRKELKVFYPFNICFQYSKKDSTQIKNRSVNTCEQTSFV